MSGDKVAAVILAAGTSARLGQPKQLVRLGKETLLDRAVRTAREAGCGTVLIVLGADADRIEAGAEALGEAIVVRNHCWREGMASSIRAAVAILPPGTAGVVLTVCDQPAVTAEHLGALMRDPGRLTASRYAGRNGVPAYLPASFFGRLATLEGDAGARELLRNADSIELPGGELDVDTPADLDRARELFGSSAK